MAQRPRGSLQILFPDGTECAAWTKAAVRESFLDALNSYSFTVEPPPKQVGTYREKLARGELLTINIDDNPLATPIIETVNTTVIGDNVVLNVQCKSSLCTPYEGCVDPQLSRNWKSDVCVDQIILDVFEPYGFACLGGDATANANALTGKPVNGRAAPIDVKQLKLSEIQAQDGEQAYAFCSRIFKRLGVVLHVDWQGNLLLRKPDYDQQAAYTAVQDSDQSTRGDRMLSFAEHDTNQGLFSEIVVRGVAPNRPKVKQTTSPIGRVLGAVATAPSTAAGVLAALAQLQLGAAAKSPYAAAPTITYEPHARATYQSTAAPYKPLFLKDSQARDVKRCQNAAKVAHSIRAARSYWIDCSVDGLVAQTGRVWTPDTIVRVVVDALELDEEFWILERGFTADKDGEKTHLKLLPKHTLDFGVLGG